MLGPAPRSEVHWQTSRLMGQHYNTGGRPSAPMTSVGQALSAPAVIRPTVATLATCAVAAVLTNAIPGWRLSFSRAVPGTARLSSRTPPIGASLLFAVFDGLSPSLLIPPAICWRFNAY